MSPAVALLRSASRAACALLVEVEGSGPLPPGAAMYIDADGSVEGSISGGCVESAVVAEAERVLAGEPPRLVTYGISDDVAGTVGLTCGGTLHVFVSALESEDCEAEAAALEAAGDQRPAAVAVVIEGNNAGARLTIADDRVIGAIGTAELHRRVEHDARALLDEGRTALRRYGADGSNIGDDVALHIRTFASPRRLLIIGATDFAAALAPIAREVGYAVTIADARARFARSRRFSRAADVVVAWPQERNQQPTTWPPRRRFGLQPRPEIRRAGLARCARHQRRLHRRPRQQANDARTWESPTLRRHQRDRASARPRPLRARHRRLYTSGNGSFDSR